jgi:hypothetical protein
VKLFLVKFSEWSTEHYSRLQTANTSLFLRVHSNEHSGCDSSYGAIQSGTQISTFWRYVHAEFIFRIFHFFLANIDAYLPYYTENCNLTHLFTVTYHGICIQKIWIIIDGA